MHRDSQKRIYLPGRSYFITTVTRERHPYFNNEVMCALFIDHLHVCRRIHEFALHAYAVMPDHVHMIIQPGAKSNFSIIMFSLKKQFSHNANRVMGYNNMNHAPGCAQNANEGAQNNPEGAQTFARLRDYREKFIEIHNGVCPHPPFRRQKSFHDHYIRDAADFWNHLRYIEIQPAKHGVPGYVWIDNV